MEEESSAVYVRMSADINVERRCARRKGRKPQYFKKASSANKSSVVGRSRERMMQRKMSRAGRRAKMSRSQAFSVCVEVWMM